MTLGTRIALWLPGDFHGSNKWLDLSRGSGYASGFAAAIRERPGPSAYTAELRRVREHANMRARSLRIPPFALARLYFTLLGSGKHDPSAWYLSAKAVEDGLVDAGVIPSDRHNVYDTAGRCVRTRDEMRGALERAGVVAGVNVMGMLVELTEVGGVAP